MNDSDLDRISARLQNLEDIEAIKQLKALYCEICDDDHNPARIVGIFTKDGIWEGKGGSSGNRVVGLVLRDARS